jgi:hypothetical protein
MAAPISNGPAQPAHEPWVQRFELQSAVAAALCTLLGVWLRTTEAGAPIAVFLLDGAYVWALLTMALGLLFLWLRRRDGSGMGSALVALALGAGTFAFHLSLPS